MKSIMYNEHFGLESATLNGSKIRTMRDELNQNKKHSEEKMEFINLINDEECYFELSFDGLNCFNLNCNDGLIHEFKTKYKVGEIVAIKQSYMRCGYIPDSKIGWAYDENDNRIDILFKDVAGWRNKMFVKSSLMPHQIQITDIKLEHPQDMSDDDCINEGIIPQFRPQSMRTLFYYGEGENYFYTPREAFSVLIDKICGKGTWNKNEYHVVYYYKLIK